jgi:hypothetical protein
MLRRLLLGLIVGLVVGGGMAAGLVAGLGVPTFAGGGGAALAYLAAALTGVVTGLVAGKPIWSSGAKIEAGLKAFFGGLLGLGVMFALRRWAGSWAVNFPAIGANGLTAIGDLPAVSLPLLAAVLGGLFELDNTDSPAEGENPKKLPSAKARQRVAVEPGAPAKALNKARGDAADTDSEDEAALASRRAKR